MTHFADMHSLFHDYSESIMIWIVIGVSLSVFEYQKPKNAFPAEKVCKCLHKIVAISSKPAINTLSIIEPYVIVSLILQGHMDSPLT